MTKGRVCVLSASAGKRESRFFCVHRVSYKTPHIPMSSSFYSVHLARTKLLSSSFHAFPCPILPPLGGKKVLFAVNTFLISCPATLRCERKGIKICIIPERNRAVTPWTQGRGEQLLAWRAVSWQHLLWQILWSPTSYSAHHVGKEWGGEARVERKGLRCKRHAESDGGMDTLGEWWEMKMRRNVDKKLKGWFI